MMNRAGIARLVAVSLLCAVPVAAQVQGTGTIAGRVVDARTGAGLAKVLVLVEGGGPSAQTSETGEFSLEGVAAGARRLFVSVVGYTLVRRDVEVVAGGVLT